MYFVAGLHQSTVIENFESDYIGYIQKLDFPHLHQKLPIIDQRTISVFVPIHLPLQIENIQGLPDPVFNHFETQFLLKAQVIEPHDTSIDGAKVWALFRNLLSNPNTDFIAKKIEQKVIQGILSKFTFSMFSSPSNRLRLEAFSNLEWSLDEYLYLSHHPEVYHLTSGLDEEQLKNPDPIL